MNTKIATRGGAGRGQGRKPLDGNAAMVPVSVKLTIEQREKLARLGGGTWVRAKIDKARDPGKGSGK